tara:strand:+ start:1175 stop:2317 length:1143 start_codon:yes stop_codon:yes gene_type:complete
MKKENIIDNPFHLKGYFGTKYFCDREDESLKLIQNAKNGTNTTLLSVRRMGKTGLIHHVFNKFKPEKQWKTIYIDIYATQNLAEFTNELASAILEVFPHNNSAGKKFMTFIKGLSPVISYDALTASPSIAFSFSQPKQYEQSIKGLFNFLDSQKQNVIVAVDEFQQIANYPEKNTEAILRTIIQSLSNVSFIFSGSHKHLLAEMFNSSKRPFFASTQILHLDVIDNDKYMKFIQKLFKSKGRTINDESIDFILKWTRSHTYYTQALCNRVYSLERKDNQIEDILNACDDILKEQEPIFYQYRNLLTSPQWKLLKAIGKEGEVYHPTAQNFIFSYQLGTPGGVRRGLKSLLKKEMIYKKESKNGSYYLVYDCFLSKWLERI